MDLKIGGPELEGRFQDKHLTNVIQQPITKIRILNFHEICFQLQKSISELSSLPKTYSKFCPKILRNHKFILKLRLLMVFQQFHLLQLNQCGLYPTLNFAHQGSSGTKGETIFVSGLHIVIVVIFPFELLGLGERIHTLGVGNRLLDPVSKI